MEEHTKKTQNQKKPAQAPKKVGEHKNQHQEKPAAGAEIDLTKVQAFKDLGIDESILKSIAEMGFDEPTEIQTKSIPLPKKQ